MRINEIDRSMKKKEHDLWLIKILSHFIDDYEIQNKVKYTAEVFRELSKNLQLYKKKQSEELKEESTFSIHAIYNYLDNDDVTYEHAISEMKDEIYTYYTLQSILVFDALTNDELSHFYASIKEQDKTKLNQVIRLKIEANIQVINQFIIDFNQNDLQKIEEKDQKFIPLTLRKNPQMDKTVSLTFFANLFQDLKRSLKYLPTEYQQIEYQKIENQQIEHQQIEYQKNEIYQMMLEIYLLIIIDNNLKRR